MKGVLKVKDKIKIHLFIWFYLKKYYTNNLHRNTILEVQIHELL